MMPSVAGSPERTNSPTTLGRRQAQERGASATIQHRWLTNLQAEDGQIFLRLLDSTGRAQDYAYTDLFRSAAQWMAWFRSKGLKAQDQVVIILKHSLELYAAFIGALLGGMVPALFASPSVKYSREEYGKTIHRLIENAAPSFIVAYRELKADLQGTWRQGDLSVPLCEPEEVSSMAYRTDDLLGQLEDEIPQVDPETIAFLQYSSGTTGLRKGVAVSHRALLWQVEAYATAIRLNPHDTIVSWLPLYHDMGLIACFMLPLIKRVPLVAISPFDWVKRPVLLLQAITRYHGTLCWLPNFAYNFLTTSVDDRDLAEIHLFSLRGVVNCSEPILTESHEMFYERFHPYGLRRSALWASYALAENTFAATSGGGEAPLEVDQIDAKEFAIRGNANPHPTGSTRSMVSSGRALPETEIRIVAEDGRDLPGRLVGEIALKSPCLLTEYVRNPEATKKAMRDGWYLTGDLGYLADGELFVIGRKDDTIIIAGQNFYPQDIESAAQTVPGVYPGRVAAFGVQNREKGTEDLVVLAESLESDPARLVEMTEQIFRAVVSACDVVPSDVRVVPHRWLLKATAGKISRPANRERYLELIAKPPSELAVRPGRDAGLEQVVLACVKQAMGLKSRWGHVIHHHTSLISSGLIDSLGLVSLLAELEAQLDVSIPPEILQGLETTFDTIDQIVKTIGQLRASGRSTADHDLGGLPRTPEDIPMVMAKSRQPRRPKNFWTRYYEFQFRRLGIRVSRGLRVLGPLILRLEGDPRNLLIGECVTLMPMVDLKIREEGKIILHDGVMLDTSVRLLAANQARLELGDDVQLGIGTLITAGTDVHVGRCTVMAGYCTVITSEHRYQRGLPVMSQGYQHAPVLIGEDVWLGAYAFIQRGSRIGHGAIIGVRATVSGDVPANSVVMGTPARVVRYRT